MNEQERLAEAKAEIEDARATVAQDTLLDADFKATANEGLSRLLTGLDDSSIPLDRAMELAASIMQAVLRKRREMEFQVSRGGTGIRGVARAFR